MRKAFTLAEVLITLGIIGVVAAITLPTLIQNYQKHVFVTRLQKAISTTQNMLKKMQADEEVSSIGMIKLFSEGICKSSFYSDQSNGCEDAYGNPSVFQKNIPKYLNVVKTCSGNNCNSPLYSWSSLSCNNGKCKISVTKSSGKACGFVSSNAVCSNTNGFYTNDGMIYYFAGLPTINVDNEIPYISVMVDVNGEKGPNIEGRDWFQFYIGTNGEIVDSTYDPFVTRLMSNGWKMDY